MKISELLSKNYAIFTIEGSLTVEDLQDFEIATQKKISKKLNLIFDLKKVHFIDSAALGKFIHYDKILRENKNNLFIINPSKEIKQIFKITKIDKQIIIKDHINNPLKFIDSIEKDKQEAQ